MALNCVLYSEGMIVPVWENVWPRGGKKKEHLHLGLMTMQQRLLKEMELGNLPVLLCGVILGLHPLFPIYSFTLNQRIMVLGGFWTDCLNLNSCETPTHLELPKISLLWMDLIWLCLCLARTTASPYPPVLVVVASNGTETAVIKRRCKDDIWKIARSFKDVKYLLLNELSYWRINATIKE